MASGEGSRLSEALALRAAALPERLPSGSRALAEQCERAAVLAGLAIGERWLLDAAYAILLGAEPPPLSVLTSL